MDNEATSIVNRKVIALGDFHYPYNIDPQPLYQFIRYIKPTHLLLMGDMLDLDYLSHFDKHKPRKVEGKRLRRDYDALSPILDNFIRCAGKKCQVHYAVGNHEKRIITALDEGSAGLAEGFVELENGLEFDKKGIKKIELNGHLKIGRICFMHGIYTNDLYTKKYVTTYVDNVAVWHMHTRQCYTMVTPIGKRDLSAYGVGCTCKINPAYAAGRPNRWVIGLAYVEIESKDGYFQFHNLVMEGSRLIWNGKIFS